MSESLLKTKTCPHCSQTLTVDNFYQTGRSSRSSWCKPCCRELSEKQVKSGYFRGLQRKPRKPLTEDQKARKQETSRIRAKKSYDLRRENEKRARLGLELLPVAKPGRAKTDKQPSIPKPSVRRRTIRYQSHLLWRNARNSTIRDGKEFTLSSEYVYSLVCEFCQHNHFELTAQKSPFQPSLDRIDSSKGYEIGNVRIVWLIENYAKNTFTEEQLIEFCKRKLGLPVD